MRIHIFITVGIVLMLSACATERYITPTITTTPRTGLTLKTPILATIFDGRTAGADESAAKALQSDLAQIYPSALQWGNYFDTIPEGRIALRTRIVILGSSFGSRLISSVNYTTAVQSVNASASGPWGAVVGGATGTSSVFGGSFSGEGWWNGAAWIDVEVEDHRNSNLIRFTIPLVSEHKEPNTWGYSSGDRAAQKAWDNVSAQLTRVIDDVIRIVRDNEG